MKPPKKLRIHAKKHKAVEAVEHQTVKSRILNQQWNVPMAVGVRSTITSGKSTYTVIINNVYPSFSTLVLLLLQKQLLRWREFPVAFPILGQWQRMRKNKRFYGTKRVFPLEFPWDSWVWSHRCRQISNSKIEIKSVQILLRPAHIFRVLVELTRLIYCSTRSSLKLISCCILPGQ